MNHTTLAEAVLLDNAADTNPQLAGSALENTLQTIDVIGTLLQGRAEPLTPEQLEAVGQTLKETTMLAMCYFIRQGNKAH
ncbi:hypothetical protein ABC502_14430 [Alkalimonas sp. NCh-2]|uniref:hypothetical protein n=1 Tax=Alkalimonas sp. NCh-2 TaxID=3144846 RepID=UPI0031F63D78